MRTRKGITPGGRNYTSTRDSSGNKSTTIRSRTTTWRKNTDADGSRKEREVAAGQLYGPVLFKGVKGPTTVKRGYKKTHTFEDGGKYRFGKTPGGRTYTVNRYSNGEKITRVGGMYKATDFDGKSVKANHRPTFTRFDNIIEKGQTRPKGISKKKKK
jgi:hypothetical protein